MGPVLNEDTQAHICIYEMRVEASLGDEWAERETSLIKAIIHSFGESVPPY